MPWLDQAGAVVEAWYSGAKGGEAIADVLFGEVDASGRLPVTFPASIAQYPREQLPGLGLPEKTRFDVNLYRGRRRRLSPLRQDRQKPLFPFGHGLSYTTFGFSNLKVTGGDPDGQLRCGQHRPRARQGRAAGLSDRCGRQAAAASDRLRQGRSQARRDASRHLTADRACWAASTSPANRWVARKSATIRSRSALPPTTWP
jgi:hypothetical protein